MYSHNSRFDVLCSLLVVYDLSFSQETTKLVFGCHHLISEMFIIFNLSPLYVHIETHTQCQHIHNNMLSHSAVCNVLYYDLHILCHNVLS